MAREVFLEPTFHRRVVKKQDAQTSQRNVVTKDFPRFINSCLFISQCGNWLKNIPTLKATSGVSFSVMMKLASFRNRRVKNGPVLRQWSSAGAKGNLLNLDINLEERVANSSKGCFRSQRS